eukprot:g8327.t1
MAGRAVAGTDPGASSADFRTTQPSASSVSARLGREQEEKNDEAGDVSNDVGESEIDAIIQRAQARADRVNTRTVGCEEATAVLRWANEGVAEGNATGDVRFGVLQENDSAADERIVEVEARIAALQADNARLRVRVVAAEQERDVAAEVAAGGVQRGRVAARGREREEEDGGRKAEQDDEQVQPGEDEGTRKGEEGRQEVAEEKNRDEEGRYQDQAHHPGEDEDPWVGEWGRKEEEGDEEHEQRTAREPRARCSHAAARARRVNEYLEESRARLMRAKRVREEVDAEVEDFFAAREQRQRAREYQRVHSVAAGVASSEAGTAIGGRFSATESARVGGRLVLQGSDVVTVDRRLASLEEWRERTEQADRETTRAQCLAEVDAILRREGDSEGAGADEIREENENTEGNLGYDSADDHEDPGEVREVSAISVQGREAVSLPTEEQRGWELSELLSLSSSSSSGSYVLSRPDQEAVTLAEAPLPQEDWAPLRAVTGQQRWELLLQEREEGVGLVREQAALRQQAEDEAALAATRHESLLERSKGQQVAAQWQAREDAERARERTESLSEQVRAAEAAVSKAEATAAAAQVAAAESARKAMVVEKRMGERLRAGEEEAEDKIRRLTEKEAALAATRYESLLERSEGQQAAAQWQAREDAERARERTESLCEQARAAEAAVSTAEATAAAAQVAAAESARKAMVVEKRMSERLRAGEEEAEDKIRRLTEKLTACERSQESAWLMLSMQGALKEVSYKEIDKFKEQLAAENSERAAETTRAAEQVRALQHRAKAAVEEDAKRLRERLAAVESDRASQLATAREEAEALRTAHEEELRNFAHAKAKAEKRAEDAADYAKQKELQLNKSVASMRQLRSELIEQLAVLRDRHQTSTRRASERIAVLEERAGMLHEYMAAMAGRAVAGSDPGASSADFRTTQPSASSVSARLGREQEEKNDEAGDVSNDVGESEIDAIIQRAQARADRVNTRTVGCEEATAILRWANEGVAEGNATGDVRFGVLQENDSAADERIVEVEARIAALEGDNARLRVRVVACGAGKRRSGRDGGGRGAAGTGGGERKGAGRRGRWT